MDPIAFYLYLIFFQLVLLTFRLRKSSCINVIHVLIKTQIWPWDNNLENEIWSLEAQDETDKNSLGTNFETQNGALGTNLISAEVGPFQVVTVSTICDEIITWQCAMAH